MINTRKVFDHKKFLPADERTTRIMIAEVITPKPWSHRMRAQYLSHDIFDDYYCTKCGQSESKCADECIPYIETDFRILAFELMGKVDKNKFNLSLVIMGSTLQISDATPKKMICAALMAWPESEEK
jgi:hypothetical protein